MRIFFAWVRLCTATTLMVLCVFPAAAREQKRAHAVGQEVDRVLVVVNHEVITKRELAARLELVTRRLRQTQAPLPPATHLQRQVLEQMVLERMQIQRAKDEGIVVNDEMVQRTLEQIAQANGLSLEQYRKRLEKEDVAWSVFVGDAKNELIFSRLRQKEVDQKIIVSDAEVANYLAHHRSADVTGHTLGAERSLTQPEEVRQEIGMHKAEKAYADWLRELRDSSYIRYQFEIEPL